MVIFRNCHVPSDPNIAMVIARHQTFPQEHDMRNYAESIISTIFAKLPCASMCIGEVKGVSLCMHTAKSMKESFHFFNFSDLLRADKVHARCMGVWQALKVAQRWGVGHAPA